MRYEAPKERIIGLETSKIEHYTEMTVATELSKIMDQIIKSEDLPFFGTRVEVTTSGTTKRADIEVYSKVNGSKGKVVCVVEVKRPAWPLNSFIEQALGYAWRKGAQFFAVCNINRAQIFTTSREMSYDNLLRRKVFKITRIKHLEEIDREDVRNDLYGNLKQFLYVLSSLVKKEIRELPKLRIEDGLIFDLVDFVESIYIPVSDKIRHSYKTNKDYRKDIRKWFEEQALEFTEDDEDFDRIARQYSYLLLDKILFYEILRKTYDLPSLVKEKIKDGNLLIKKFHERFASVTETYNYDTVFGMNFIDRLPLPNEVVENVVELINLLNLYDFGSLNYETIGDIYQKLIPKEKRHPLGQYFTPSEVVDTILGFCIKSPKDVVLDPGCGAGTFLVRAYSLMKFLQPTKSHKEILSQLYGIDIAKFPAHLSTINLVIKKPDEYKVFPNIINKDFFRVFPEKEFYEVYYDAVSLDKREKKVKVPFVGAVVGNPPYTRQEEIKEVGKEVKESSYKENLEQLIKSEWNLKNFPRRAGIYVHFSLHALKFLGKNGRFGFVTSNSWLDVEFGKILQEIFLKNYKIVAVIEPKLERWFEDADINTAITILEKCDNENERDNNLVKFVQLKSKLKNLLPEDDDDRWKFIKKLVEQIENSKELFENEIFRIYTKSQKELWKEGYDEEEKKYVGSKWGKYIRAPDIFFKILDNGEMKFTKLASIAEIKRGYIPWPYEFYILDAEQVRKFKIEKEFLRTIFRSPDESNKIFLDKEQFNKFLLVIDRSIDQLKEKNVLKYIKWGENQKYKKINKKDWFRLEKRNPSSLISVRTPYNRHIVFLNNLDLAVVDHVEISVQNKEFYCTLLNSSIYMLLREFYGRSTLGLGTLKVEVMDVKTFPIIKYSTLTELQIKKILTVFQKISKRQIGTVYEEIGANSPEEVSLNKIKSDRRELDKIVMGEILGLTEKDQLEVYRAVIDLVKSRIERARSVEKVKTEEKDVKLDKISESVGSKMKDKIFMQRIPQDFKDDEYKVVKLPDDEGIPKISSDVSGIYLEFEKNRIKCSSLAEAKFLFFAFLQRLREVKVSSDKKIVNSISESFSKFLQEVRQGIKEEIDEIYIKDEKRPILEKMSEEKLWNLLSKD